VINSFHTQVFLYIFYDRHKCIKNYTWWKKLLTSFVLNSCCSFVKLCWTQFRA